VILKAGFTAGAELADALARFAVEKLAYFKIPGWVAFVESLPTTYSQKLRKGTIFGEADPRRHPTAVDVRRIKQRRGRDGALAADAGHWR
jgi:hypothetical protein